MANKPLKSIKFPGLNDTYTVPEVDATLAVAGAAADAKKVGDEISGLKADLSEYLSFIGATCTDIDVRSYNTINAGMQSDNTWGGKGTTSYKSALVTDIPDEIKVTANSSGSTFISFFKQIPSEPETIYDQIYFCNGETGRRQVSTGETETFTVPSDCLCIVVGIKVNGADRTPTIKGLFLNGGVLEDLSTALNSLNTDVNAYIGEKLLKNDVINKYQQYSSGLLYQNYNVTIGTTTLAQIPTSELRGAAAYIIDLNDVDIFTYPVFKTTGHYASFILNSDDVVIWVNEETELNTGTEKTINVPSGASYMLLSISSSLLSMDWYLSFLKRSVLFNTLSKIAEPEAITPFIDENRNLCLAGIKTDILTDKIPYHRGYLFHKLQNNDGSLWYGTDFKTITKIGDVTYNPTLMRFAISPKDGRIIAVQRDTRNGIWVWDGSTETHLDSFTTKPQAWLYNSGVDFINDGSDEYCIFAEYSSTVASGYALNVWRGKYPYTSVSDWEIVLTQNQRTDITHFHMVRRDPWSDVLYLTAGDGSAESKWWYSTDAGATWTLLVSGTDTGWGNSTCRTINFIFTKDYIYWATDHGASEHALFRIARDSNTGVIDLTTKEKLCDLPNLYATNSLCYVESPRGLFMYDRIDTESSSIFGEDITMKFYDLINDELVDVVSLGFTTATWGGSRGKCYVNYTNGKEVMPAMGFSIDTPCIFDLVCDNPSNIGTIAYDIGSKTVHTINY